MIKLAAFAVLAIVLSIYTMYYCLITMKSYNRVDWRWIGLTGLMNFTFNTAFVFLISYFLQSFESWSLLVMFVNTIVMCQLINWSYKWLNEIERN